MKSRIRKILLSMALGLVFFLAAFGATQPVAQAQTGAPPNKNCQSCHIEFHEVWEMSSHGQAAADPVFRDVLLGQESPEECLVCHTTGFNPETGTFDSEGVGCLACHYDAIGDHPQNPMRIDRSEKLCGSCHTETDFAWQISAHQQSDITCVVCHDPHANSLKANDASALCGSCHQTKSSGYTHSAHSSVGLNCADCHLEKIDGEPGPAHADRDHSFYVKLESCTSCHANQLHEGAADSGAVAQEEVPDAMSAIENADVSTEASPVSPVGFATLSALIGMASGMILSPWLERFYERIKSEDE